MKRKNIIITVLTILLIITVIVLKAIFINPYQTYVRTKTLETDKLTKGDYTIAYFSDLYYGELVSDEYVDNIINKVNGVHADVVIFGGDLIASNNQNELETLISKLSSISAKYAKIAVLGDQDYEHEESVKEILTKSGFTILRNSSTRLYIDKNNYINIYGFDSLNNGSLSTDFINLDDSAYNIAVMHEPDSYITLKDYNFDYCLAGHSLGGQIYIPLISDFNKPEGCQTYFRGTYNNKLDITNGVGRINYNIRLNARQEIVVYKLSSTYIEPVVEEETTTKETPIQETPSNDSTTESNENIEVTENTAQ